MTHLQTHRAAKSASGAPWSSRATIGWGTRPKSPLVRSHFVSHYSRQPGDYVYAQASAGKQSSPSLWLWRTKLLDSAAKIHTYSLDSPSLAVIATEA